MNKRKFLKTVSSILAFSPLYSFANTVGPAKPMEVLMLGGRGFLGPTLVNELLRRGHRVTLLNRGITNPHLFPKLDVIICDRETENLNGLRSVKAKLQRKNWDCVIDTWQKSPKAVRDFIEMFDGHFKQYQYVSTLAVYDKWTDVGIDESHSLTPVPNFPATIKEEFRYAVRKTLAENIIQETLQGDFCIHRCHGIRSERTPDPANPHEEPYWPIRFVKGDRVLLPQVQDHYMQVTDALSLAQFIAHCAEQSHSGVFNVAYPSVPFEKYIQALVEAVGQPDEMCWIPGEFLIANEIRPYEEIEHWRVKPAGAYRFDVSKALQAGLVNRPLVDMIKDQVSGYLSRYPQNDFKFGGMYNGVVVKLSSEKEQAVIARWKASQH